MCKNRFRKSWFSPGGLNRGIIKNVIKLAFNPTKTNRDDLYSEAINPVVSFQGEAQYCLETRQCNQSLLHLIESMFVDCLLY